MTSSNCRIDPRIVVGQEYTIQSENLEKTGIVRINSIDYVNCNISFSIMSGDWDEETFNVDIDTDLKLYYEEGNNEYCIINKTE